MVMLFLWKPHQMVQNPEARNLDPINNTSCSPMVPVQPCYIAEWKKMAGKNKKLIKKLEAKQKKLYNENSFHQSVLCLHTNKAGKTTETWHTGRQGNMKFIPDHWKKHIKDITGGKNDNHFSGPCQKTRQRRQLDDMNKKNMPLDIRNIQLCQLELSSPCHHIIRFLQALLICETALFLWYRIFPKRPIASQMFFTVLIPDDSTARFPDQCHFISPKHDRYHPGCNFSDPDQKNPSVSCFFITTVTDSRSNKA